MATGNKVTVNLRRTIFLINLPACCALFSEEIYGREGWVGIYSDLLNATEKL